MSDALRLLRSITAREAELAAKHERLIEVADELRIELVRAELARREVATAERRALVAEARVAELEAIVDALRARDAAADEPGLWGACERCGKRGRLITENPGLHEKDVCASGCEVKP